MPARMTKGPFFEEPFNQWVRQQVRQQRVAALVRQWGADKVTIYRWANGKSQPGNRYLDVHTEFVNSQKVG